MMYAAYEWELLIVVSGDVRLCSGRDAPNFAAAVVDDDDDDEHPNRSVTVKLSTVFPPVSAK